MILPDNLASPVEVGRRLRALREAFGLSGTAVAEQCGLDQSNYSKVEKGAVALTVASAAILARLYGCDLDYLFLGDPKHAPAVTQKIHTADPDGLDTR